MSDPYRPVPTGPDTIPCPECDGTGGYEYESKLSDFDIPTREWAKCRYCLGSGRIVPAPR